MEADLKNKIELTVLFFSVLREKTGCSSMDVTLDPGSSGGDLLDLLSDQNEAVKMYRSVIRLAVNAEYARENIALKHGDEVALITPVSGG
ncbi:MAG: MoaD/ThiS family protein [Rhodothermales bacterium]